MGTSSTWVLAKLQLNNESGAASSDPASGKAWIQVVNGVVTVEIDTGAITTLVSRTAAETLTNKTLNADNNTVTNIGAAEVKPDLISGQTQIMTVDGANDRLLIWDATDSLLKEVAPDDLPGSGGAVDFTDLGDVPASYTGEAGKVVAVNGTEDGLEFVTPTGGSSYPYILIRDEKASGTNGGTFTSGAWQTRTLNTEASDTGSDATLSSNQITLAAGTYRCRIIAPAFKSGVHQTRLYNATDAATVLVGSSEHSRTGEENQTHSFIVGRFTIGASKALEVQHRCGNTKATDGFGVAAGFGEVEVYTIVELWKE